MRDQNSLPLVTAVVRTYNRATMVGRAIDSILAQTFSDYELIIMDDCSLDNTEEVVKERAGRDSRIRYVRLTTKINNVKALNLANEMARGKYIAYLDDDDAWRPRKLELQVNRFESGPGNIGLVTGGIQYANLDTGVLLHTWIPSMRGNIYWQTLGTSGHMFGPPSVVMIPKKVLEDVGGFREDMPRGACQHLFRRIAKKYEIDYVEEVVLDYYYHKNAISSIIDKNDVKNCIDSLVIKIESTREDLEQVPDLYAGELFKLAHFYFFDNQFSKARETFGEVVRLRGGFINILICRAFLSRIKKRIVNSKACLRIRKLRAFLKGTVGRKR